MVQFRKQSVEIFDAFAVVAQLVECDLAKVDVAGSSPVYCSIASAIPYSLIRRWRLAVAFPNFRKEPIMTVVLTLPETFESRAAARSLTARTSGSTCVLDAGNSSRATLGALDELVKGLIHTRVERVIVVNAGETLQRQLQTVHRARATPESSFLMTFREVAEEALLRAV